MIAGRGLARLGSSRRKGTSRLWGCLFFQDFAMGRFGSRVATSEPKGLGFTEGWLKASVCRAMKLLG